MFLFLLLWVLGASKPDTLAYGLCVACAGLCVLGFTLRAVVRDTQGGVSLSGKQLQVSWLPSHLPQCQVGGVCWNMRGMNKCAARQTGLS